MKYLKNIFYEDANEILEYKIRYLGHQIRKQQNLTQEELGKLVGVQKAQISKIENSTHNCTIETILKIFHALKAEINFSVKMENEYLKLV